MSASDSVPARPRASRPRWSRIGCLCVVAFWLAEVNGASAVTSARAGASGLERSDARAILRSVSSEADVASAVAGLTALGAGALPALLESAVADQTAPSADKGQPEPAAWVVQARDASVTAIGRATVVPFLRESASRDRALVAVALNMLALVGRGSDLELAVDLTRTSPASEPGDDVVTAFERCAERLVRSEPQLPSSTRRALLETDGKFRTALVRVVGRVETADAFVVLASLLDVRPESCTLLLQGLWSISRRIELTSSGKALTPVRAVLGSEVTSDAALAVRILARLRDMSSTPSFVQLLEHGDVEIRRAAAEALRHVTGLGFGDDAGRWKLWNSEEQAWLLEHSVQVVSDLGASDARTVMAAIQELVCHPCWRVSIGASLSAALQHEAPEVRLLACAAAEVLRAKQEIRHLIERLDDSVPAVSERALKSLRSITGKNLPPDSLTWRLALEK